MQKLDLSDQKSGKTKPETISYVVLDWIHASFCCGTLLINITIVFTSDGGQQEQERYSLE